MSETNGNAALHFIDRHRSGEITSKPAFIEAVGSSRKITYGELADQTDRLKALYKRHDLRREDRVAMLLLDTVEFPVIFWGSLKAGIIPIPINTLLSTEVYDTILRDSRARALFISNELLPVVQPVLKGNPFLKTVFVVSENRPERYYSFNDELARSKPEPLVECSADEVAFWLYSSGSTGQPKGVRHVHGALRATADTYGARVLGIQTNDIIFSVAKMFFAYGLGNAMTFPMSVGATTILLPERPTPQSVCDVLRKTKPTIFCGVPTFFAAFLALLETDQLPDGFDQIRLSISAGEALPKEIGERWHKLVGSPILDGVGSTELLHIFLSNAPDDFEYGTSGTAVPGYDVRLVDDENVAVGPGELGELLVSGGSAAADYWNQRDKNRVTFEGMWTRTGDKYERREDGRYIYCGRTDDMFKVSGIWVSPFEVEQAIISHSSVLEAAVVAARDSEGLEKPKAFIVLKQGGSEVDIAQSIKEHVQEKIGKWKYPRWIVLVDELPKTATGKVQRFKLRELENRA